MTAPMIRLQIFWEWTISPEHTFVKLNNGLVVNIEGRFQQIQESSISLSPGENGASLSAVRTYGLSKKNVGN